MFADRSICASSMNEVWLKPITAHTPQGIAWRSPRDPRAAPYGLHWK
jgi:hypothetical protein